MVRKLTTAALAMLAVSCAPETQKPMKVRALVLSSNGQYEPTEVELQTVTDIVSLEGQVVKLQGGARIVLDSNDPEAQAATTEEAFQRALLKEPGRSVTASYIADEKGVLWPADFHTWNLITTYYNFERAWNYFTQYVDVKQAELPQMTAYYFPEFILADSSEEPGRDNAVFFAPVQGFLVLPFDKIEKAPLAINASVLTHEYSHMVFNRRVYDGRSIPDIINAWSEAGGVDTPGLNVIKSLDEGLADYHAYVASCQSTYGCNKRVLYTSFEGAQDDARDLSKTTCMSRELRNLMNTANFNTVFAGNEYKVGTILASSLFHAEQTANDRQVLARAVVAAYSDTTNTAKPGFNQLARAALNDQGDFTLAVAAKSIIRHITDFNLKQRVCSQFATRLQIPVEDLTGGQDDCPDSTTLVTGVCESINP
ncbi:hypothetical protein [Vitiosangium sp. GDMCC 1.1324]|uniref:hypothetical protein n=1 Tax=Vitiosangium sp. (strain GDMCC 1.1324) TaxID=2138576 RepID=UPI000D38537F|nr:hypothetical protein [Vitiosangium sp. GDMCC 1.1324]PTL76096.1 hypothetical protein DAT35_50905 [Vitiosangium sp. GDMCC 1.1324]